MLYCDVTCWFDVSSVVLCCVVSPYLVLLFLFVWLDLVWFCFVLFAYFYRTRVSLFVGTFSLTPSVQPLPCEIWTLISGFLQTPVLSHVCSELWQLLRGRYLSCHVNHKNAPRVAEALSSAHNLDITGENLTDSDTVSLFEGLKDASLLCNFRLCLQSRTNRLAAPGLRSFATLSRAPVLHTLTLELYGCEVGVLGANQLAALCTSESLTHLTLGLRFNRLGDEGAAAISALRRAPALRSLTLDLGFNKITDEV